jgi:hypothetical protein
MLQGDLMNKRTVLFKKCVCEKSKKVSIILDTDKISVFHLISCHGCGLIEVFPDNFKYGDGWEYKDGRRTIEWERADYREGFCYLYEEEQI